MVTRLPLVGAPSAEPLQKSVKTAAARMLTMHPVPRMRRTGKSPFNAVQIGSG
jgi:hypothetical protein